MTDRRHDLPAKGDGVFAKALAKNPADRYASCRDFAEALRAAFDLTPYDRENEAAAAESHPATQVESLATAERTPEIVSSDALMDRDTRGNRHSAHEATATYLGSTDGSGTYSGTGGNYQSPPAPARRSRRVPAIVAGVTAAAAAAIALPLILTGSGGHPTTPAKAAGPAPSITIAAGTGYSPLDGISYVQFMGGKNAAARISGEITSAANGEVAQLYAQPFPFTAAPIQVNASILHPAGKAAAYSFQVTPSVATQPESLTLGSGSPQVSIQPISVTEFDVTIAFSYRINGTNYASSSWEFCFPDTEPQDGLGLPGHHGCGDKQISYSSDYVG